MNKKHTRYILIILAILSLIIAYFYTKTYGLPWKRNEIKKLSVDYMKKKYNMDVEVAESSYAPEIGDYYTKVYNLKDKDKNLIIIEEKTIYNDQGDEVTKRLEDSYSEVYWKKYFQNSLLKNYSSFTNLSEVETIDVCVSHSTLPLGDGVSCIKDENDVNIPLEPIPSPILDITTKTPDISEAFLKELLPLINIFDKSEINITLNVTTNVTSAINNKDRLKVKLIEIEPEKFKNIKTLDDLKKILRLS